MLYTLPLHDALPISRAGDADLRPFLLCRRRLGRRRADRPGYRQLFVEAIPIDCRRKVADSQVGPPVAVPVARSEEHTSELQSRFDIVCRLLLEKKK